MTENDLIATHQTWAEPCDARLITPSDEAYERGRRVWNGMIDRRPAGVLRCTSANDVRATPFGANRCFPGSGLSAGVHGISRS